MNRIFETERLIIKPVTAETDALFILELLNTEGWLKYIGDRGVKNEDDAVQYIRRINQNPSSFYNVIRVKEDGFPIGMVSLMQREFLDYPDLGFALLPGFEGKGYAFEAVKAYLDLLLEDKKYAKITAFARSENTSSIRLMERLGFHFDSFFEREGDDCSLYILEPVV